MWDIEGVSYYGADVVPGLIVENNRQFGNDHKVFILINEKDKLDRNYDLIYARQVLQHLKDSLLIHWLREFKKHCKYLVCYTNPGTWKKPIQLDNKESGASTCRYPTDLKKILIKEGWKILKAREKDCLILAIPGEKHESIQK